MKIFAIMLVKDEADVVASVLKSAETWADKIFILDNGSTDGTWEIVQSMRNDIITPWKQYFGPYHNGLRALVYNEFKNYSKPGDWWCFKLDADEIYYDNPKDFLKNINKKYGLVAKKSIDYYLCQNDVDDYSFTGNFENDISHIKHIRNTCWSEPRFFRQKKNIKWTPLPDNHYPSNCGKLSKEFILVKHYQFRSPQQMQKRLDIRNNGEAKKQGLAFRHVKETKWQELLYSIEELVLDNDSLDLYKSLPIRNNLHISFIKKIVNKILRK